MSQISEQLRETWQSVSNDIGSQKGLYSRRVPLVSGKHVHAAFSSSTNMPEVAIDTAPGNMKKVKLARKCKGFEVTVNRQTNSHGTHVARIRIALTREPFRDMFLTMVSDLIERYCREEHEATACKALETRLDHWSRFAEIDSEGGLSLAEQIGLYGELLFIAALLDDGFDGKFTINAWHGPDRKNQDFLFGHIGIEVKTSTSNVPERVKINSAQQLDSTGLERLYLRHSILDRRLGNSATLSLLIRTLRDRLEQHGDLSELDFDEKLLRCGIHSSQIEKYDSHGYTERGDRTYEIQGDFPRLTEKCLPEGVSEVRYVIDLSSAKHHQVELNHVTQLVREQSSV